MRSRGSRTYTTLLLTFESNIVEMQIRCVTHMQLALQPYRVQASGYKPYKPS